MKLYTAAFKSDWCYLSVWDIIKLMIGKTLQDSALCLKMGRKKRNDDNSKSL